MSDPTDRALSPAERKRLEKFKNRRGRKNPARIPARLARTSAFAPKRTRLITDSNFERLYVVPGHSVIKVSGRELGTQHRDTIYAVFRLPKKVERVRRVAAIVPRRTALDDDLRNQDHVAGATSGYEPYRAQQ